MKKLFSVIVALVICSLPLYAESSNEDNKKEQEKTEKQLKKEAKAKEKALRAERDSIEFTFMEEAIQEHYFVVTADRIRNKKGYSQVVDPSTNFVLLQGDKATIQFALGHGFSGPNGLGGITVEGKASNIKIDYTKKGNLRFSMMVIGSSISAEVSFTLPKNGKHCDATVRSNFNSTNLTFSGKIQPYKKNLYKGRSLP